MPPKEKIDPDKLNRVAALYQSDVAPHLASAASNLSQTTGIEQSNFTSVCAPLAVTYVEAVNFENRELQTKQQQTTTFGSSLAASAKAWRDAEQHNVIPGGS